MRIGILTNVTAPYRTELFSHIKDYVENVHVYFQSDHEPFRTWQRRPELPYGHTYLKASHLAIGSRRVGMYRDLGRLLKSADHNMLLAYGFSSGTAQCLLHAIRSRVPLVLACDATPHTDPCSGPEFWYRRAIAGKGAGCIAASSLSAEYFQRLGVPRNKIEVIELSTDLHRIRDAHVSEASVDHLRQRLGPVGPIICLVARMYADKRILDACAAVLGASADIPGIKLAIAGDGPVKSEIQEWALRYGQGRIHLLGLLSWEELLVLYRVSDMMLFPATREKFGMVVLEALASGVPVITYDRSGAGKDLVRDGENGFVVSEGNVDGLRRSLVRGLSDRELLKTMKESAKTVVENHDIRLKARRLATTLELMALSGRAKPEATAVSNFA